MKIMRNIILLTINALLIWFIWITFFTQLFTIAGISAVILILFNMVFILPNAYPFRYMFPGLLCFFIFMIFPIMFTVYIGLTNLGTGHLLPYPNVKKMLLEETFSRSSDTEYSMEIIPQNDNFYLFLRGGHQRLKVKTDKNFSQLTLNLIPSKGQQNTFPPLTRAKIFKLKSKLKKLKLILPNGNILMQSGMTTFTTSSPRYRENSQDGLYDQENQKVYTPNFDTGLFSNGSEYLSPGFSTFVGLKNFHRLFLDKNIFRPLLKIFIWTCIWGLFSVFLTFSLGIALALVLNNKNMRLKNIYRMFLIIPYSIPFFISVLIFRGMMNKDFGIINELLGVQIPWLEHALWAKISCLLVNLWLGFPYMLLVTTGILQSIPNDVYEAAKIDGAGKIITFRKITLPMVMSAIAPLLVGSFAFNFNNFVGIYLLTGGLPPMENVTTPAGETDILISYTYRLAFEGGFGQDFGLASAIAVLIFIVIAIITIINFRISGVIGKQES